MVEPLSAAQRRALAWLDRNGGLSVPNMNMAGRSKEWPTRATLKALLKRELIDLERGQYEWTARVNAVGLAALRKDDTP